VKAIPDGCIVECVHCGSVNSTINHAELDKLYSDRGSSNYPSAGKFLLFLKRLSFKLIAKKYFYKTKGQVIVDYGCGGGEFLNALSTSLRENRYLAVDLQDRRPESLLPNIEYISVKDFQKHGEVDVVILRHVIEHFSDPVNELLKIKSKLSKSGEILIECPIMESAWRKIMKEKWPGYFYPFHTFVPSTIGLGILMKRAGLDIYQTTKVEPPVFGVYFMYLKLPRTFARFLSIIFYPLQWLVSLVCLRSEAILVRARSIVD
jgi:SAM-dependent methyltransferase